MKSTFTSFLIIALSISITTTAAFAEKPKKDKPSNSYKGFVITTMGDSLFGHIEYINPVYNELKVKFVNEEGKKKTFKTRDIVEYAFLKSKYDKETRQKTNKWVHYIRKRVDVSPLDGLTKYETLFLQRVTIGRITLYNYYTLSNSKVNQRKYEKEYFIEQMTPQGFDLTHINKLNYKEEFKGILADSGVRSYGYLSFHMAVKEYNNKE